MTHGTYPSPRDPAKVRMICTLREQGLTWAEIAVSASLSNAGAVHYLHTRWHSWWRASRIKGTP